MKIDLNTVDRLAHLARLEFDEQTKSQMLDDMNRFLEFAEKLNELDTAEVAPLIYMNDDQNVMRKDEVIQELSHEEALKNAPKRDSDFFRVPKVIEK
ncbi:MAG: Asp-tRNA(Asn)/Glu-tRNA(Gln) amidotransferase subunit GatC [Bacteroidia bacterium]